LLGFSLQPKRHKLADRFTSRAGAARKSPIVNRLHFGARHHDGNALVFRFRRICHAADVSRVHNLHKLVDAGGRLSFRTAIGSSAARRLLLETFNQADTPLENSEGLGLCWPFAFGK
jgi:hypothetical protein